MSEPTRRESGLDIDEGNRCSKTAFGWAKTTFGQREGRLGAPIPGLEGSFSNLMDFGQLRIAMATDGIGTKVELAERTGVYHTVAFDMVAMVCDDLAANGIEPVNLTNVLDVDHLDHAIVDELLRGLAAAAAEAGVAVVGGEIAELGDRVGGWGDRMHFNWSATGIGVLPAGRQPIDGSGVAAGQAVIGMGSRGLRSNGFSLVRRIMRQRFGPDWHAEPYPDGGSWGEELLTPSKIYTRALRSLWEAGLELTGLAHITGGGLGDNLARVLSSKGLGAELDRLPEPHAVMLRLQELGEISEAETYRLWNMGVGMIAVTPSEAASAVIEGARGAGCRATVIGEVTKRAGIRLHTRGADPQRLTVGAR